MSELQPTWTGPVRRVEDASGSHIEPPFDPGWGDADALLWWAAVASLDTGLRVRVHEAGYSVNGVRQPGFFCVQVGWSSIGPMRCAQARAFLSGVTVGAREQRSDAP